jgi:hypothetical protein
VSQLTPQKQLYGKSLPILAERWACSTGCPQAAAAEQAVKQAIGEVREYRPSRDSEQFRTNPRTFQTLWKTVVFSHLRNRGCRHGEPKQEDCPLDRFWQA